MIIISIITIIVNLDSNMIRVFVYIDKEQNYRC